MAVAIVWFIFQYDRINWSLSSLIVTFELNRLNRYAGVLDVLEQTQMWSSVDMDSNVEGSFIRACLFDSRHRLHPGSIDTRAPTYMGDTWISSLFP